MYLSVMRFRLKMIELSQSSKALVLRASQLTPLMRNLADRARSLSDLHFLELHAVVMVFSAHEILHNLPLLVPAVHVVLEVLLRAHLLGLVEIEVPFDLIVLLRDFIHEHREGRPGLLVFVPGELNLTGIVDRGHWPDCFSEVILR